MIKKPLSQLVLQDLHLKLNHKLKDLKTVPIHDFQGFLTSIKNDLNNEILGTENHKEIKSLIHNVSKTILSSAKSSVTKKLVKIDSFNQNYFAGTPLDGNIRDAAFDLVIEENPNNCSVWIFGQEKSAKLDTAKIMGEAEHRYGKKCNQVILKYSTDVTTPDVIIPTTVFSGNESIERSSKRSPQDIGKISFDKTHKLTLKGDPHQNVLWGKISEDHQLKICVGAYVIIYSPEEEHTVVAKISDIGSFQMHTSTNFLSLSELTLDVKLNPLNEIIDDRLCPIVNKKFLGHKIRFPTTDELLMISGMSAENGMACGWIVSNNGERVTAYFPYNSELSVLDKTLYLTKLYSGIQNAGKTNGLAFDIRMSSTSPKIPANKRPAIIILDGEDSFLEFPKIKDMVTETRQFMQEHGYDDIDHQVLTISDDPTESNCTLSFSELELKSWHYMLPSLAAKTESQMISVLRLTLDYLERENLEPTVANLRRTAVGIAGNSNIIHRTQVPAIARALESPELDLFSMLDKTVLTPDLLFKPGKVTTINVKGLDMSRRRVVALYLLELLQKYKVIERRNDPGIIFSVDECEQLFPYNPTKREQDYVDRIVERIGTVTQLGRKRMYGCIFVTHRTEDVAPQIVQLANIHMPFRSSGGENKYIIKYIGKSYINDINGLETGFCIMKTNVNTATHNEINAKIQIPFVGFADDLTSDAVTTNEDN